MRAMAFGARNGPRCAAASDETALTTGRARPDTTKSIKITIFMGELTLSAKSWNAVRIARKTALKSSGAARSALACRQRVRNFWESAAAPLPHSSSKSASASLSDRTTEKLSQNNTKNRMKTRQADPTATQRVTLGALRFGMRICYIYTYYAFKA